MIVGAAKGVSIVIPVYNERSVIGDVVDAVTASATALRAEVLVVDDGSTDGTGELLDECVKSGSGIQLLRHPVNRGKAAAIRTALGRATGDVVLIQDADLEYSPRDYGRLLAPFCDPEVQAVYGSRFLDRAWPTGMKVANWVANRVFAATANLLYGAALTDEGTGYKAIRRQLLLELGIATSRFEFCPEVTAKLLLRGARIVEVPVSYAARDRSEGKKPGLLDGLAVLWTLLRLRVRV